MPPSNPDLPRKNPFPGPAGAAGNRPVPLAAGGQRGGSSDFSGSNRPIPLKPRNDVDIPDDEEDNDEGDDASDLREVIKNAPAWLVSTVFHMTLLIVLGLMVVNSNAMRDEVAIEVSQVEDLGTQLENPSEISGDVPGFVDEGGQDPIMTPQDLPPVDDPLVGPPVLGDIQLSTNPGAQPLVSGTVSTPGIALALSGREAGSRKGMLGKYGGTAGTEAAVELALQWLAKQQKPDGAWSLSGPYPDGAGTENAAAATAMALLAFQGHGDTHKSGNYMKVVARGWSALLKMQRKDGSFSGGRMTESVQGLYTHAQGTIAVCELYGMTHDSLYRSPAERAVAYAVEAQDVENGGWRYLPRQDSDTSVTGWFMMALQSARMAKLKVPDETLRRITFYLDSASVNGGRQYGYWHEVTVGPAMSAEGLLCRQYLGWPQNDERLVEGVSALLKNPVSYSMDRSMPDVYYWYYATQAAHHMEGKIWEDWNAVMRKEMPEHQVKKGPEAGSWDPINDKWGSTYGRLYVTCLSVYNLEVYYRHLPIYSGYRGINALPPVKSEAEEDAAAVNKPDEDLPAADEGADGGPAGENAPKKKPSRDKSRPSRDDSAPDKAA